MTETAVPPSGVTGGSHGLAAGYAAVRALASTYDTEGNRLRSQAGLGARTMADDDLLESALLAPWSFAEAEAAVLSATTGPDGLLVQSLAWEADALVVRVTIRAFEATDELVHATFEVLDYAVGRAAGFALAEVAVSGVLTAPLWLPPLVLAGGSAITVYAVLPPALQDRLRETGGAVGDALGADVQEWLIAHPELLQHLVNGGGGFVDGFWDGLTPTLPFGPLGVPLFTPSAEDAGQLLAGLYPDDGSAAVAVRDDLAGRSGPLPVPSSLADVMAHLEAVNEWSGDEHPENNGTIEIQSWTGSDGVRHHIVYLPGTDDLTTLPWAMDGDVRDLPTNFLVVNGQSTAYAQGILQSMHAAGIGPTDPVLLAGHSQGGIEAAWIASHTDDFHISQVVTAGSPIAVMGDYPDHTQVMAFEHHGDVVPLLDGEDNPDAVNHVTITFDDHETDLGANHGLVHYVHGAAGADRSTDPSITDQLAVLHEQGFLGGGVGAQSQAFQITRQP